MSSVYDDTIFNFDLNFLHTGNSGPINLADKQRKALLVVKKKTLATDKLIQKYHANRDLLDQTQKALITSQDECKQICIDYRNALNACTKLENDAQILQNINKDLEEKCFNALNQHAAVQSHANQLQSLIKQNESLVESLTVENKLVKASTQEYEKKYENLQKENCILIKHICLVRDIILGQRKSRNKHKTLFRKYENLNIDYSDLISGDDDSPDEEDTFEDVPSSPVTEDLSEIVENKEQKSVIGCVDNLKRDENSHVFECNNEVTSVDTGRGSSLAFSDSEKCFRSPDYCLNDSPLTLDNVANENVNVVDVATSPIPVDKPFATASNSVFDKSSTVSLSNEIILFENETSLNPKNVDVRVNEPSINIRNRAVSPSMQISYHDISTSPITNLSRDISTSPIREIKNKKLEDKEAERVCLELNNSDVFEENSSDPEIETILSNMRINYNLVTPIPSTPAKTRQEIGFKRQSEQLGYHICEEAAIARQENKKLQASIADLVKEVMNIKSLLKNQLLLTQDTENNEETTSHKPCKEICVNDDEDNYLNNNLPNNDNLLSHSHLTHTIILNKNDNALCHGGSTKSVSKNLNSMLSPIQEEVNMNSSTETIHSSMVSIVQVEEDSIDLIECNNDAQENFAGLVNHTVSNKESSTDIVVCNRSNKMKKLTKLEKLRKKMLPKCKIKNNIPPPRKLRTKSKPLENTKKKIDAMDTSATLNDKTIYEKAVKIMSEIKAKNVVKHKFKPPVSFNKDVLSTKVEKTLTGKNQSKPKQDTEHIKEDNTVITNCQTELDEEDTSVVFVIIEEDETPSHETECDDSGAKFLLKNKIPLKRHSTDLPEAQCKRMLRSSTVRQSLTDEKRAITDNCIEPNRTTIMSESDEVTIIMNIEDTSLDSSKITYDVNKNKCHDNVISYSDLDVFSDNNNSIRDNISLKQQSCDNNSRNTRHPKNSTLCVMVEKYGRKFVKTSAKKVLESVINDISKKIEDDIEKILETPYDETKNAMNKLSLDLQSWNMKQVVSGLIKFLKDPSRKQELFGKVSTPPAPPMTKPEQVLLYIISQLKVKYPSEDILNCILNNIEYVLFKLNHTPEFDTIESMSHFYAVLCRYFKAKSKLRLFMLDAMYCIQFKAVPIIKQCLEVWPHILPLAHMGIAKCPLVTCMVYLLHFYKCEDRFNRVQDLRNILNRKYFYQFADWNESKILEMFKHSIVDMKEIPIEKKMMKMSLILIAKRHGPRWCQNHIIKNLLLPLIEKENVTERVKLFCVSMIGPLLKPYPIDMKVHCEIVMNQLFDMLQKQPSQLMEEAIISSLIYLCKHNQFRVHQALLSWRQNNISPELELLMRDFVREKPIKTWKSILSRITLNAEI